VQLRLVSPQRGDNRFPVDAAGLARYCPSLIVVRLFVTRGLDQARPAGPSIANEVPAMMVRRMPFSATPAVAALPPAEWRCADERAARVPAHRSGLATPIPPRRQLSGPISGV